MQEGARLPVRDTEVLVPTGEREERFEHWAAQAGIKAPKLRHEVFQDPIIGDLRGLKAVEATSAAEQIAEVPVKATITLMASESTPFESWVSSSFWDSQQWYVKLALKLLWERGLGDASSVNEYVKALPAQGSFNTLIHWTDEELDRLNYASSADSARRQRAAWERLHQDLVSQCPDGAGRSVTKDDFVWAMECVLSRAFSGCFGGGRKSLFVSAGLVAAACATYAVTDEALWLLLAAVALLPVTLPELGSLGTSRNTKAMSDYVLVPFVDSMNHVTMATTDLSFSPLSGDLGVAVNRDYGKGDQVYISYGRKTNDELLQFYGFVEADCPADTYVLGGIMGKIGVPEERLRGVQGRNLRAALETVVIRRGEEVVDGETVEALRRLLGAGKEDEDATVAAALRRVCQAELAVVQASPRDSGVVTTALRERLASSFRREKASVLEEAIERLSTSTRPEGSRAG